ncbi:hypothetical protein K8I85_12670, partial [bacterium]|nr:hypothetical protein [bacterium]
MRPAAPYARAVIAAVLAAGMTLLAPERPIAAPDPGGGADESRAPDTAADPVGTGTLRLRLLDAETSEPVAWANVV